MEPSSGQPAIDQNILRRVRALLAKAESTSFAQEAAALTAKANQLMAAHAISRAMAEDNAVDGPPGRVVNVRIVIEAPYAKEKLRLLAAVAAPNRCRTVMGVGGDVLQEMRSDPEAMRQLVQAGAIATVFGYETDIEIVQVLYTSLLVQAVNTMLSHGSMVDIDGTNRTRSFRHSFLVGFASTVADRLEQANGLATQQADNDNSCSRPTVLPVLAARKEQVDEAVAEMFPTLGRMRTTYSNHDGLAAGQSAGSVADVGATRIGRQRRSIGQ